MLIAGGDVSAVESEASVRLLNPADLGGVDFGIGRLSRFGHALVMAHAHGQARRGATTDQVAAAIARRVLLGSRESFRSVAQAVGIADHGVVVRCAARFQEFAREAMIRGLVDPSDILGA
ncbi:MAG: hypothetical protein JNL50_13615 [Phycisphaerae bacterium]|nr:hypothetical protein [Phycisphaerae bacterium]